MNMPLKKIIWSLIFMLALVCVFFLGRWNGALQANLALEKNYPQDLHRKLSNIDVECAKLRTGPTNGKFFVQALDGGDVLLVSTWQQKTGEIKAFALNSAGQQASDSWFVPCP
jgi:hypothetical protein